MALLCLDPPPTLDADALDNPTPPSHGASAIANSVTLGSSQAR
jgi:hypothetical protein